MAKETVKKPDTTTEKRPAAGKSAPVAAKPAAGKSAAVVTKPVATKSDPVAAKLAAGKSAAVATKPAAKQKASPATAVPPQRARTAVHGTSAPPPPAKPAPKSQRHGPMKKPDVMDILTLGEREEKDVELPVGELAARLASVDQSTMDESVHAPTLLGKRGETWPENGAENAEEEDEAKPEVEAEMEAEALRKLRHPSRSKKLKDFLV
ncbi:MAG: hypothetical protein Q7T26_13030 [Dehalococcoidia bacterium]|nr:hypothetical protein [Dehalococcoidia bacterium]